MAKNRNVVEKFNLAPNEKTREYTPDWMFKNSIPLCEDGCGNCVIWMNVSRIDSLILFICHDPSEVTVIAESPAAFFENLRAFLLLHDKKGDFDILYEYLQNWSVQSGKKTGIGHKTTGEKDIFEFGEANVGDSVSLHHRGKYTIVMEPELAGQLILATEDNDIIKKVKRRDQRWTIGFLIALGIVFTLFYRGTNGKALVSIGYTILSLFFFGGVFSITMDFYYSWKDKR